MKKPIKLIFVVFFIFIVCFSLSIIIKHYFEIEGDYLSAFSTLVAAVVAYFLFTDWKDEHKFEMIQKLHIDLKNSNNASSNHLSNAKMNFSIIEGSSAQSGEKRWLEGISELGIFLKELNNLQNIIYEYRICLSIMHSNLILKEHIIRIMHISDVIENIQSEFKNSMPRPYHGIANTTVYLEFINKWQSELNAYDSMCKKGLIEFYVNYLNSIE